MSYVSTKSKNFNAKQELENLFSNRDDLVIGPLKGVRRVNINDYRNYEKEFVKTKVDKTGRYKFDTRTNKKYNRNDVKDYIFKQFDVGGEDAKTYNEKFNATKMYLRKRIQYENHLKYKSGDVKNLGLGIRTYDERLARDTTDNKLTVDGKTVFGAVFDKKLKKLEKEMNDYYAKSNYFKQDMSALDVKIEQQIENSTKNKEEQPINLKDVSATSGYVDMRRKQLEIDKQFNTADGVTY